MIVMLFTCMTSSYFIAIYFMSTISFESMSTNIDLITAVYSRKTSIENAVQGLQESLSQNRTVIINSIFEEIFYYIRRGMEDEASYQQKIV